MEPPELAFLVVTARPDGGRRACDNRRMRTRVEEPRALATVFHALAAEWRADTRFSAAPSDAVAHPAYRAVVRLGPAAVPLILAALAEALDPWFAALRELTGEDSVPPEDRGQPRTAVAPWLAWGHSTNEVDSLDRA